MMFSNIVITECSLLSSNDLKIFKTESLFSSSRTEQQIEHRTSDLKQDLFFSLTELVRELDIPGLPEVHCMDISWGGKTVFYELLHFECIL